MKNCAVPVMEHVRTCLFILYSFFTYLAIYELPLVSIRLEYHRTSLWSYLIALESCEGSIVHTLERPQ